MSGPFDDENDDERPPDELDDDVEPDDEGEELDDEDEEEGDEEEEGAAPARRPATGWQRLTETFAVQPAGTRGRRPEPEYASMSPEEVRSTIMGIGDTERKIGIAASILGAIAALVVLLPPVLSKAPVYITRTATNKKCTKPYKYHLASNGQGVCRILVPKNDILTELGIVLVLAIGVYVAVRIGRRSFLTFATFILGLSLLSTTNLIVAVPFLGVGVWLMMRSYRTQKYGAPTARVPLPGYVRPGPPPRTRVEPKARASAAKKQAATKSAPRGTPGASKRYTPKKAAPKKAAPPKKAPPDRKGTDGD